ncbi:MAG TPA: SDR family oxidoreductase [Flavitalea sp.]|nr:SDR family oxidoreductase [Flavitalea sp.]
MKQSPVVIITGAAGGIGKALALKYALNGYALTLADINGMELQDLQNLLQEMRADFICLQGDLQDDQFVKNIIDQTLGRWGRVDTLVNNAAWRTIETMRNISLETWEKTIKVCLTAPAFLAKHAAAVMEERQIAGTIINVSSVMSHRAGGYSPAYVACKGAMESLSYELAALYGIRGIRVVAVSPGNIQTQMSEDYTDGDAKNISERISGNMNEHTPLQRAGTPEEIAEVVFWLSSKGASFVTGVSLTVDGGFAHNFNSYQIKKLQFPKEF